MRDIKHPSTSILYDFEDPFLHEKNSQDESFQFFKFISPTVSTWAQRVSQSVPNFTSNRALKDLRGSKSMSY